jgi:ATP-dependent RNA helicase SUPV3L1/SUV3
MFELDASGAIRAGALTLAHLARGATLTQPEVRLAPLEDVPAGVRSRLQRRLLAFARDVVGRLLGPLESLQQSERAPLRAIAYQLGRHLGSALRSELAGTLDSLTDDDRDALNRTAVEPGKLAVFLPALLGQRALGRRLTLVRAFEATTKLPPVGRASFDRQHLSPELWISLGYIVLGRRAFRLDLAERAASLLVGGAPEPRALECLAVPRREAALVAGWFREALPAT